MKPFYTLLALFLLTFLAVNSAVLGNQKTKYDTARHYIGEHFGGGIIFYLEGNGEHGLIAAMADQNRGIVWYNGLTRTVGKLDEGRGAGPKNTKVIVEKLSPDDQNGNFAAKTCALYSIKAGGVTYNDWYLPSKTELDLLYKQKKIIGGFTDSNYWSSNEYQTNSVWVQNFGNGQQRISNSESYANAVRAIRSF